MKQVPLDFTGNQNKFITCSAHLGDGTSDVVLKMSDVVRFSPMRSYFPSWVFSECLVHICDPPSSLSA